ncbi:MAG: thioredoxin family protein [Bacilli bacterium]|nr:thioredoxin family protein [Bacilli bacterium]
MKNRKSMPEKSIQVISCALAVVVMILLMSGDMIMSKILRVNPNQDYPYDTNHSANEKEDNVPSNKEDESSSVDITIDTDYDVSFMKSTNLMELQKLIQTGETIYVFSGRSTCPPCRRFVPILKKVVKEYQLENVYYLNQSLISETTEGYDTFIAYSTQLQEKFGTTPYFMVFKNQKYQTGQIGMLKEETLENYLRELFQNY